MATTPLQSTLRPGLVSVTYRKLTVQDVARATVSAGLQCIEWGGGWPMRVLEKSAKLSFN
jgi:hypothetical protein